MRAPGRAQVLTPEPFRGEGTPGSAGDPRGPEMALVPAAVYLLQRHDGQRFKIGWSREPISRVVRLPEFEADELDLVRSQAAWLPSVVRAQQVERALHRGLATFSVKPAHQLDGYTEWFRPEAQRAALSMIRQMPLGTSASCAVAIGPFLSEPDDAYDLDDTHSANARVLEAQDVLWRMEDVLLRVAAYCPISVEGGADQHVLRVAGFKRRGSGPADSLRWAVLDVDRYRWQTSTAAGARAGSFVQLIEYDGDDLLLRLAPMRQVKGWLDGAMTWPMLVLVERLRGWGAQRRDRALPVGARP